MWELAPGLSGLARHFQHRIKHHMSAHDSSQLDQSESFQQLKSEYERLQLLYRIAKELESGHSLPQALERVIEQTTAGTGAAQGGIVLVGEHGEHEIYLHTSPGKELVCR
jgi:nitrate/nitrite-specific signal transduction histidine kinase